MLTLDDRAELPFGRNMELRPAINGATADTPAQASSGRSIERTTCADLPGSSPSRAPAKSPTETPFSPTSDHRRRPSPPMTPFPAAVDHEEPMVRFVLSP